MRKTFKEVQAVFASSGNKIEKIKTNYYIVNDNVEIYTPKVKMEDIINFISAKSVEQFIKKYRKDGNAKKEQILEEMEKTAKRKAKAKDNKKVIVELEEKCTEITLQILALRKEERHTAKHMELRAKLHELYAQLEDFGAVRMITRKGA